ncbi:Reverse transcriptase [Theobroma cacao]|nr:Reverse transcriptase [Theobroma cacao]
MPFGLCNTSTTFQICMIAISSDMVEQILEVLRRCEEMNLVLNWEKCHFMVEEGNGACHTTFVELKKKLIFTKTQMHYTIMEKELLAIVYAFDKFYSFLVSTTAIVYTNHDEWDELILFKQYADRMLRRCQRVGNISRRCEMSLNSTLEVEIFDVWGIDFMGPLISSFNNHYISWSLIMCRNGWKP